MDKDYIELGNLIATREIDEYENDHFVVVFPKNELLDLDIIINIDYTKLLDDLPWQWEYVDEPYDTGHGHDTWGYKENSYIDLIIDKEFDYTNYIQKMIFEEIGDRENHPITPEEWCSKVGVTIEDIKALFREVCLLNEDRFAEEIEIRERGE